MNLYATLALWANAQFYTYFSGSWVEGQVSGPWQWWTGDAICVSIVRADGVSTHPEARRLHHPIFKTGPFQVGIVMSFKKSSHGLVHLPARPRLVSDLDQCSQEGQVYPVGMDSWLQGRSRKEKKARRVHRKVVTLSEQVSDSAQWLPCPQVSRPSVI